MPNNVSDLVGPCLERICVAASGRRFTQLRHEAKVGLATTTCKLLALSYKKEMDKANIFI